MKRDVCMIAGRTNIFCQAIFSVLLISIYFPVSFTKQACLKIAVFVPANADIL